MGLIYADIELSNPRDHTLVLGDSRLMGAVPMEDGDLVINPREQRVTLNPASPTIPTAVVMRSA